MIRPVETVPLRSEWAFSFDCEKLVAGDIWSQRTCVCTSDVLYVATEKKENTYALLKASCSTMCSARSHALGAPRANAPVCGMLNML